MTRENHLRGSQLLDQIKRLESLSDRVSVECMELKEKKLQDLLSKCNEVIIVLKEINEDKFKEL